MTPPDDREKYHKKTPPAGVRAQLMPEEDFSGKTDVGAPPEESRARVGDLIKLENRLTAKIEESSARVEDWVRDDRKQHDEIRGDLKEQRGEYKTLRDIVNATNTETLKQSVSIDGLVKESEMSKARKQAIEIEKAKIDLQAGAQQRSQRSDFWWGIAKKAAVGVVIIATALATHYIEKHSSSPSVHAASPQDAGAGR